MVLWEQVFINNLEISRLEKKRFPSSKNLISFIKIFDSGLLYLLESCSENLISSAASEVNYSVIELPRIPVRFLKIRNSILLIDFNKKDNKEGFGAK